MPVEVYFDQRIEGESNSALKTHLQWSKASSHLAVASYDQEKGGTVNFYQDDGSSVSSTGYKSGGQVTALAWHPSQKYLALGWQNGEISVWNDADKQMYENADAHKQSLSVLQWNENGMVLVSSDARGLCLGWKLDSQGGLVLLFTQELKDVVTDIVFRSFGFSPFDQINRLAKAAVDGDEKALNMFSSWTSHSYVKPKGPAKESTSFYVGTVSGMVFYISDNGSCNDVLQMEGSIQKLLHNEHKDMLIVVTEMLALAQFKIGEDGSLTEHSKVKLSGRNSDVNIIWAGKGVLAVSTGEQSVRLWNLESGHNLVLQIQGESWEAITCLAYDFYKDVLAAGTNQGRVILWSHVISEEKVDKEDELQWNFYPLLQVRGAVKRLDWGTGQRLLGVLTPTDVYIISQQAMCYAFKDQVAAVQVSARQIAVEMLEHDTTTDLRNDVPVRGIHISVDHIAISNGRQLHIYEVPSNGQGPRFVGSFNTESTSIVLHEQSAFAIDNGKVEIRTFQGTIKQTLTFSDDEGVPICMDQCGNFLVVGTEKGYLRIWDLGRREAKPHAGPKLITSNLPQDSKIKSAKCNCKGNKVSVIIRRLSSRGQVETDSSLYIWDIENDGIIPCDFSGFSGVKEPTLSKVDNDSGPMVKDRFPVSHFWDPEDARLLVCEAKLMANVQGPAMRKNAPLMNLASLRAAREPKPDMLLLSLFVTSEHGVLIQDTCPLDQKKFKLIGVRIPYFYLIITTTQTGKDEVKPLVDDGKAAKSTKSFLTENMKFLGSSKFVVQLTMRDFIGLESCDKLTKEAIITFSFFLTTGNMDEAFKAIKVIKNESVWENMGKMCVKTKKLDVALVCLGKMGNARGARALRQVADEPETDAKVAVLALQLGMVDEAERLLKDCERYDMLNQLYQHTGQWMKALEIAEEHDRVHLRNTYYNYAKYLESKGDITGAIPLYEKSETHHFEVPRMLFDEPSSLESYIVKSRDKELHKWWAQYMESIGEMELALQFYEAAQDYLSLVRVYCYCNNLEKASEIANETGDQAACFHLGRQFENQDNVKEAIHFFTRAHAYNNAIRICKEHGMEDQLLNLALVSGPHEMLEVANYYENKHGHQDKAIMLYHKAGFVTKAVELALRTKEYSSIQAIASELNENSDPHILQYCAQFFLENKQYDKAVDLLATAKKYMEALELCLEHNITITEPLAEKLTMPKTEGDPKLRATVLEKIGECCMLQDDYHLAAKKFTQAGNKVQAMKALLKSGDTEKIVFFANVSRQREIYIMAANYLQSLDWRQDADIMKNIIGFYTKGKALDLLAGFYDACAQVEIDEYQNYEKALGAFNEALKCLTKQQNSSNANASQIEKKISELKWKMELVKRFIQARRIHEDMPEESVKQCRALLEENSIETAIRRGDIYAFLVERLVQQGNYKAAYELIEEMQSKIPGVNLPYYISIDALKSIYRHLDIQPSSGQAPFFTEKSKMWQKSEDENNIEYAEEVVEEQENEEFGQ